MRGPITRPVVVRQEEGDEQGGTHRGGGRRSEIYGIFDPYAGEPNLLAMTARAPHPHAAILFTDRLLSQEGQVMLADIPRLSIRKGVKQKGRLQDLFVKDFIFVKPASYGANTKQLIDQFNQIFGLRS